MATPKRRRRRPRRKISPDKPLTDKFVMSRKPIKGERPEYRDLACPGLYLVVHPTGRRVWAFRYQRLYGGVAKLTLGEVDTRVDRAGSSKNADVPKLGGLLTLSAARVVATEARHRLKQRRDPGQEYLAERGRADDTDGFTFEKAAREFIEKYHKPKNKAWRSTASRFGFTVEADDALSKDVRPNTLVKLWRRRPLTSVERADVVSYIDGFTSAGKHTSANRTHAMLNKMFDWYVERGALAVSPMASYGKPHDENVKDRKLTDDELAALWRAAKKTPGPMGHLVRLIMLTGQRRDEVRLVRRSELQGDVLVLSGERTKNGLEHSLPLSRRALELFAAADAAVPAAVKRRGNDYLLLSADGRRGLGSLTRRKEKLDELMLAELKQSKLKPWTFHDLRRTMATRMGEGDLPDDVIGRVLNHSPRGVTRTHYNHSQRLAAMREAMEWWGTELSRIVGEKAP